MGLICTVRAREAIARLPPPVKRRVKAALRMLAEDPYDDRLDLKRLRSPDRQPIYRLRVKNHRIVFAVGTEAVHVVRVFHRRDGYGWMERR